MRDVIFDLFLVSTRGVNIHSDFLFFLASLNFL
jgi:hypothetical protein